MLAELRPGELFDKFFQRSNTPRKRNEGIGFLKHDLLSLMHRVGHDHDRLAELRVQQIQQIQNLGRGRGIVLFRRTSPLTEALAFRGFSEAEAGALQNVLAGDKPIDPRRFEGVEACGADPEVRERWVPVELLEG